jgi:phospholipid-binding lipoprotein MlaA
VYLLLICAVLLCLIGCAKKSPSIATKSDGVYAQRNAAVDEFDDVDEFDEFMTDKQNDEDQIKDPFEPWNRVWFGFNDVLLIKVLKPTYTGYAAVVNKDIRASLSRAVNNFQAPIRIVNSALQGRLSQGLAELGRFIVNSTAGLGGLIEVIPEKDILVPTDLGNANFRGTLAVWGFSEGWYVVWPLLGPSTVRDTVGTLGDSVLHPWFWITNHLDNIQMVESYAVSFGLRFNDMGGVIAGYELMTNAALEPYVAIRSAYVHLRRGQVIKYIPVW